MFVGAASAAVERQLWQLLHAHHVDALAPAQPRSRDVERLAAVYDGTLFTEAAGYQRPGRRPCRPRSSRSVPTGRCARRRPDVARRASTRWSARLPAGPRPVPVCDRRDLREPARRRVEAAPSPRTRRRDRSRSRRLATTRPASRPSTSRCYRRHKFARGTTAAARASGRRAFIYNGILPRTGTADAGRRPARPDRERLDRGDDGDRALVLLGVDRSGTTTTAAATARWIRSSPPRASTTPTATPRWATASCCIPAASRGSSRRRRSAPTPCFPRYASRRSGAASRTPG